MVRRTLLFCFILLFTSIAPVFAADFSLDAPDSTALGVPFYVSVRATGLESVEVQWLGRSIDPVVSGNGVTILLGVGLNTKEGGHELAVTAKAGGETVSLTRSIEVKPREYPEQHLEVARKMVHLSQEQLDRHYKEKARVKTVLDKASAERYWGCPFQRPVPGIVTSAFGLRRFFNGEPRKPHSGVDLRAAEGAPVKALASGVVVLAEEHYFSGNVVYLDHGQGLISMYCHLSKINVSEGRFVTKGDVIGLAGSTGRVTGPHLHLGVGILGQMVDPLEFLNIACPKVSEGD